jgi:(p)ppGpp synthase/HD superfamily hydrolase
MDVVAILRHVGGVTDESMLCAAALHDVVEECDVELEEITRRFGQDVSSLVAGLTRVEPTEEAREGLAQDEIWSLRSSMLLAEIREMGEREQVIKLADRVSNLRQALVTKTGPKRRRYVEQSNQILQIVPRKRNQPMWDEIRRLTGLGKRA